MTTLQTDLTIPRLPFAFWLEDRLEKSAIFIVDPDKRAEQRLNLYIENRSEQTLFFAATDLDRNPPSRENCHFELRFRRGLLADESLKKSKMKGQESRSIELLLTGKYQKRAYDISSWVISEPDDHDGQQPYVSFYLARSEKGSGGRFGPGERQQLVLTNISGTPEGDTSESRVELVPRNVYYDAPNQVGSRPVTEPREQTVLVVNHLGKEFIPLHVAFVGPYTVRNDGEPQGAGHQLRLRLTNTSRHDTITFAPKSRVLFDFDFAEGDQEEELGTAGDVAKIKFYFNEQLETNELALHPEMAQNPIWELSHNLELATRQLAPHEHWDILMDTSEFVTASPAGLTPLHITYESIPGYWDGKLFAAVEKTPLVVRTTGAQEPKVVEVDTGQRPLYITGKLGIGTSTPEGKLHVNGNAKVSGQLQVTDKVGIGTATDPNEQLNVRGNSKVDGRLQVTGNVGIGTNMPESKLHIVGDSTLNGDVTVGKESNPKNLKVHGRIKDQTGYVMPVGSIIAYGGNEAPEGWLVCDGQYLLKEGYKELSQVLKTPPIKPRAFDKGQITDLRCSLFDGLTIVLKIKLSGKDLDSNDHKFFRMNFPKRGSRSEDLGFGVGVKNKKPVVFVGEMQKKGSTEAGNQTLTYSPDLELNKSYNIVVTFKKDTVIFCLDGNLLQTGNTEVAQKKWNLPTFDNWYYCYLGSDFDGQIEDFQVYYHAFSEDVAKAVGNENVFKLPDLRSRFVVGAGYAINLSSYPLGNTGGEEKHTLTTAEMPNHNHPGHTFAFSADKKMIHFPRVTAHADWDWNDLVEDYNLKYQNIFSQGDNQPHNNLPPYYALTYIIKY